MFMAIGARPDRAQLGELTSLVLKCSDCDATIEINFDESETIEARNAAIDAAIGRHKCVPRSERSSESGEHWMTMLERMLDSRVFEITANENGTFDVTDRSDGAMSDRLTAQELERLGQEIIDVARGRAMPPKT